MSLLVRQSSNLGVMGTLIHDLLDEVRILDNRFAEAYRKIIGGRRSRMHDHLPPMHVAIREERSVFLDRMAVIAEDGPFSVERLGGAFGANVCDALNLRCQDSTPHEDLWPFPRIS